MECKFSLPSDHGKAIWEITSQCNYMCEYCMFSSCGIKEQDELGTNECFKIIDELASNNFLSLKITGGEPFLRDDIIQVIKYAKRKMKYVDVSTNASLITPKLAHEIKKTDVDKVHVSLDGYNQESHESIRGKNTFLRTLKGIEELKKEKLYIRIGSVIYKGNENKLKDIVRLVINLGVDEIIFSIMVPMGRMQNDYTKYKTKSDNDLVLIIENLKKQYKSKIIINYNWQNITHVNKCPAGEKLLFINNLGEILPCTWIKYKNKLSLKEDSLKNILDKLKTGVIKNECQS